MRDESAAADAAVERVAAIEQEHGLESPVPGDPSRRVQEVWGLYLRASLQDVYSNRAAAEVDRQALADAAVARGQASGDEAEAMYRVEQVDVLTEPVERFDEYGRSVGDAWDEAETIVLSVEVVEVERPGDPR